MCGETKGVPLGMPMFQGHHTPQQLTAKHLDGWSMSESTVSLEQLEEVWMAVQRVGDSTDICD